LIKKLNKTIHAVSSPIDRKISAKSKNKPQIVR
jgi:hypothetical protein